MDLSSIVAKEIQASLSKWNLIDNFNFYDLGVILSKISSDIAM